MRFVAITPKMAAFIFFFAWYDFSASLISPKSSFGAFPCYKVRTERRHNTNQLKGCKQKSKKKNQGKKQGKKSIKQNIM
jgi:hypothetical protein